VATILVGYIDGVTTTLVGYIDRVATMLVGYIDGVTTCHPVYAAYKPFRFNLNIDRQMNRNERYTKM